METFTPDSTKMVHNTKTDFRRRMINKPIHIVQYDNGLPIIAVSLYLDGTPYEVPTNAEVNVRVGKPDRTFVYNKVLGCNSTRTIVYFNVTAQMTMIYGLLKPVLEIVINDEIANTGHIDLLIDRNPVQEDDVESTAEYTTIQEYALRAEDAISEVEQLIDSVPTVLTIAVTESDYESLSESEKNNGALYIITED